MLTIWGRANSINVQKVMWAVGELGLEHDRIDAGGQFGGLDTEEFRAMNPNARVPVISDGGIVVWESHAIVRYLAAKYGQGSLWPEDPAERSLADRWMDWTLADLQPAFIGGVFWNFWRTPDARRNWPVIRQAVARTGALFSLIERHLVGKKFLAGEIFTMADITAGAQLYRYYELKIERPALPNVRAWYERLAARKAYQDHVMVPFDDLRGRL